jgi:Glycosyl hydrolases family 18
VFPRSWFSRSRPAWILATAALCAAAAAGAGQAAAQAAQNTRAGQAAHPASSHGHWPSQVYTPYYETWLTGSIPTIAAQSGARYLTLAFIQTASQGSCSLTWNGDSTTPIPGSTFASQVAQLQRAGGDVIPSFGGYSADEGGTEIADSCTDVGKIAAAYESVITTYHVTRLDMDVEANSLNNTAGISRRNQAVKLVEQWAAHRHLPLQVQYTIPVEPTGLEANALAVLQNAVATGTRIDVLNIMTFDYYLASEPTALDMGAEAISAAKNVHAQLASLYPHDSQARLWAMEGITLMPGIDDYPGKTEVTSLANTKQVLDFAKARGLSLLSIWAIQRDNGGCPGTVGASTCSGVTQSDWAFSHLLEHFDS